MRTMSHRTPNIFRHGFAFAVAFVLLAAGIPAPATAANLTLSGSTTASCAYSSATMDASGHLTIVTSSSCGLAPPADSLAFGTTAATVQVNGTVGITVTRANPTAAGGVSGTVSATGGCTVSNLGFAGFSGTSTTPVALTVTAPATAGACTISLGSLSAGANLGAPNTFDITVTTAPVLPSDALAFSAAAATVASSGSTTVNVSRATANYSNVSASVGVTSGACAVSTNSASFSGTATTPVTVTVTAPAGPATCVVTLSSPSAGATIGTTSTFTLTVSAPVTTSPPIAGCSTTANANYDIRTTGRVPNITLGAGQVAAVRFYVPGDAKRSGMLSTAENINLTLPPDVQVNVSDCPGDFSPKLGGACGTYQGGWSASMEYSSNPSMFWVCTIDISKTLYLNIKFPSCTGTCGTMMDRF